MNRRNARSAPTLTSRCGIARGVLFTGPVSFVNVVNTCTVVAASVNMSGWRRAVMTDDQVQLIVEAVVGISYTLWGIFVLCLILCLIVLVLGVRR